MTMVYITDIANLTENMPFKTVFGELPIVIWKTKTGIYCLLDCCSHEEYPLSESEADDEDMVTCVLHGAKFDITNGYPVTLPAFTPVQIFPILIRNEKIYIDE